MILRSSGTTSPDPSEIAFPWGIKARCTVSVHRHVYRRQGKLGTFRVSLEIAHISFLSIETYLESSGFWFYSYLMASSNH